MKFKIILKKIDNLKTTSDWYDFTIKYEDKVFCVQEVLMPGILLDLRDAVKSIRVGNSHNVLFHDCDAVLRIDCISFENIKISFIIGRFGDNERLRGNPIVVSKKDYINEVNSCLYKYEQFISQS